VRRMVLWFAEAVSASTYRRFRRADRQIPANVP